MVVILSGRGCRRLRWPRAFTERSLRAGQSQGGWYLVYWFHSPGSGKAALLCRGVPQVDCNRRSVVARVERSAHASPACEPFAPGGALWAPARQLAQ
jgi:hypothetical protein